MSSTTWLYDSCSDSTLTGDQTLFVPGSLKPSNARIHGVNPGACVTNAQEGFIRFKVQLTDDTWRSITTSGFYVPDLNVNILTKNGLEEEHLGLSDSVVIDIRNRMDTVTCDFTSNDITRDRLIATAANLESESATKRIVGLELADPPESILLPLGGDGLPSPPRKRLELGK